MSGSGCHGDHLQGPGCLCLSVQPRDQEMLTPALQLGPLPVPPRHPALLPTGQVPGGWDEGRHPGTHLRVCRPVSPAGLSIHLRPCFARSVGPTGFLHFRWRPQEEHEASLSKHSQQQHSEWGQFPGMGQSSRAPSYLQACPPGVHSEREILSWAATCSKMMRCPPWSQTACPP